MFWKKNEVIRDVRLQTLVSDYLEIHASKKKSKRSDEAYTAELLSFFGNRRLSQIRRRHALKWFSVKSKTAPIAANRALEIARCMFNLGIDLEYCDQNPFAKIKKNTERSRERYLSENEARRLLDALSYEPLVVQLLFKLYLVSGLRKEELRNAKWSDLNTETGILHIASTKNKRPHRIPLPVQLVEEILTLPKKSDYIFAGKRRGSRVCARKAWDRMRQETGLYDVRIHDLRRTAGSWLAQDGVSLQAIGDLLNQKSQAATQVYSRLDLKSRAAVITSLNRRLDSLMEAAEAA